MFHTSNPIIKHKAGLLNLASELQNVSKACKIMGVSRDTFYRYQELVETDGLEGLINRERRVPNLKNRVDEGTEQAVIGYAVDFPAHGQRRTSNELRKRGVFVSGSGIRSIWLRHKLENFKGRLSALEAKVANEGIVLSDAQIAALERKHEDDVACGEIETAHPGYLGAQDTFYVGNQKAWVAYTSRRLLIPTARSFIASCTRLKHRLLMLTCGDCQASCRCAKKESDSRTSLYMLYP